MPAITPYASGQLPGDRPPDAPVQLRFSGRLSNGKLVVSGDLAVVKLAPDTPVTLLLDAHYVTAKERRSLLRREDIMLLPAGEMLYSPRPYRPYKHEAPLDPGLLAYAKNVWAQLDVKDAPYAWMGLLWMEIYLLDPLVLSTREHGGSRLKSCRCRVPWLDAQFPTLNQALAAIVRLCEPHRGSTTANAMQEVFVPLRGSTCDVASWRLLGDYASEIPRVAPAPTSVKPADLDLPLDFGE